MITKKQKAVLDFITKYHAKKAYAPSLEEIKRRFRLASVSTAHFHVKKLEGLGYLKKEYNKPRSIRLYKRDGVGGVSWGMVADAPTSMTYAPMGTTGDITVSPGPVWAERKIVPNDALPLNKILCGDAIGEMKKIPDNSIDMTFADPPFNLNKKYGNYKDKKASEDYVKWCEQWLSEMVRITKPTGSILVHNIPKWLIYFANHLNKIATFKHWVAWDAMSVPLGKTLLPAHYGILFYTKIPKGFKFHELRSPHKKCRTCSEMIKDYGGKKSQIHPHGTLLSDVWADIHRIRHNTRRDAHPCQLPEPLLERLILMTTDEGDVVLDPFVGAGTTALAAKRLGRSYIGIDIDPKYKKIVADKIKMVIYRSSNGYKYNGDAPATASKYLRNLTISEDEGIYPIDNPKLIISNKRTIDQAISLTLF